MPTTGSRAAPSSRWRIGTRPTRSSSIFKREIAVGTLGWWIDYASAFRSQEMSWRRCSAFAHLDDTIMSSSPGALHPRLDEPLARPERVILLSSQIHYTRSAIRKTRGQQAGASRLLESAGRWRARKIPTRSPSGGRGAKRAAPKVARHAGKACRQRSGARSLVGPF